MQLSAYHAGNFLASYGMHYTPKSIEILPNRFTRLGIGRVFPRPGTSWTRLGDHIHWLDLIHRRWNFSGTVANELFVLCGGDAIPQNTDSWFSLVIPVESTDLIACLMEAYIFGSDRFLEDSLNSLPRVALRNSALQPTLLAIPRNHVQSDPTGYNVKAMQLGF